MAEAAKYEYGLELVARPCKGRYDAIVLAVAHQQFKEMGEAKIRALGKPAHVLNDLKYLLPAGGDLRL